MTMALLRSDLRLYGQVSLGLEQGASSSHAG